MKNWYQKCRTEIVKIYGDDADLFCDLLAACSPRKHVRANWRMAERIYKTWKTGQVDYTGCLPCHIPNVNRALSGQELSGRKVQAFAENLKGNLEAVTVDVWTARFFGFDKITNKVYSQIVMTIKAAASYENQTPAETQAEIWCEAMMEAGRKPLSFLSAMNFQLSFWSE